VVRVGLSHAPTSAAVHAVTSTCGGGSADEPAPAAPAAPAALPDALPDALPAPHNGVCLRGVHTSPPSPSSVLGPERTLLGLGLKLGLGRE